MSEEKTIERSKATSATNDSQSNSLTKEAPQLSIKGISETIGQATSMAWVPLMMLGSAFQSDWADGAKILPPPIEQLAPIVPATLSLLICAICGIPLMMLADRLRSRTPIYVLWIAALICLIASLCVPYQVFRIILVAIAYAITSMLWKMHMMNKAFTRTSLLLSGTISGLLLLACSLFGPQASSLAQCVLLLISLSLFMGVAESTLKNWKMSQVEWAGMRGSFSLPRRLFTASVNLVLGMAYAALIFILSSESSLAIAGLMWIVAGVLVIVLDRQAGISRSMIRGSYLLASAAALLAIPLFPGIPSVVISMVVGSISVTMVLHNSVSHLGQKKDSSLSDIWLSGFRLSTNCACLAIGFVAGWAGMLLTSQGEALGFAFFDGCVVIVAFTCLLSLGTFNAHRKRRPLTTITDPWHEKVQLQAKEHGLSPRQTEILDMLSRGRNAKYIAERLFLSEGTVKKHIFQVYKIMGVHNQQDLITIVLNTDLTAGLQEK